MDDILARLYVTESQIAAFCEKWKITQFELFGSVLRDDFDAESDVDVLVVFAPDAKISLFGLVTAEEELRALVGRRVDLVERRAIEESPNWIRRRSILNSTRLIYAAARRSRSAGHAAVRAPYRSHVWLRTIETRW